MYLPNALSISSIFSVPVTSHFPMKAFMSVMLPATQWNFHKWMKSRYQIWNDFFSFEPEELEEPLRRQWVSRSLVWRAEYHSVKKLTSWVWGWRGAITGWCSEGREWSCVTEWSGALCYIVPAQGGIESVWDGKGGMPAESRRWQQPQQPQQQLHLY